MQDPILVSEMVALPKVLQCPGFVFRLDGLECPGYPDHLNKRWKSQAIKHGLVHIVQYDKEFRLLVSPQRFPGSDGIEHCLLGSVIFIYLIRVQQKQGKVWGF